MKGNLPIFAAAMLCAAAFATAAQAGTVENLERERALALGALLSADLSPSERQERMSLSKARMVDLERMALRDEGLRGKDTPTVRAAFENYDLTFLAHASIERRRTMIDHWMEQVGISTGTLMNARMGRR